MPKVHVSGVSKRFRYFAKPRHMLLEWASFGTRKLHQEFWALRDIEFTVMSGECLGIIGANGAGKSTLLKLINGTLDPTTGTIQRVGRILSLLELSAGFTSELTGRQNVFVTSDLLGFPEAYVRERLAQIEEFADIGEFFDRPIKLYSSGMTARLAFAVYAFLDPDLLVVDEALSVGDVAFQRKSYRQIEVMVRSGKRSAILVSHDHNAIKKLCDRVIWLERGRIVMEGDPAAVVEAYLRSQLTVSGSEPAVNKMSGPIASDAGIPTGLARSSSAVRYPDSGATFDSFWFEDESGNVSAHCMTGTPFHICYAVRFLSEVRNPVFGFRLVTPRGENVLSSNTAAWELDEQYFAANTLVVVRWPIRPGLAPGQYFASCGCSRDGNHLDFYCREVDAYKLTVHGEARSFGICDLVDVPLVGVHG